MNTMRYVEVNAQKFLYGLGNLLNDKDLMESIMNDEHYVLRIATNGIEICYPEDPVRMPS